MVDASTEEMDRVPWFVGLDYEIMKFFHEHDFEAETQTDLYVTPKTLSFPIDKEQNYIGRRLRTLRDAGFIEQVSHGVYKLGPTGEEYLRGNLSEEELQDLDPSEG